MSNISATNITVTNLSVKYINGYPASMFGSSNSNPCGQTEPTCDYDDSCPESYN